MPYSDRGARNFLHAGPRKRLRGGLAAPSSSPVLEVLDRPLVLLRRLSTRERPQVLTLPRLLIRLAAIDTKFTGFELTNHGCLDATRPIHRSLARPGPANAAVSL